MLLVCEYCSGAQCCEERGGGCIVIDVAKAIQ